MTGRQRRRRKELEDELPVGPSDDDLLEWGRALAESGELFWDPTGEGAAPLDRTPPVEAQAADVPEPDVLEGDVPEVEVPDDEVPEVEVPAVEVPELEPEGLDVPEVEPEGDEALDEYEVREEQVELAAADPEPRAVWPDPAPTRPFTPEPVLPFEAEGEDEPAAAAPARQEWEPARQDWAAERQAEPARQAWEPTRPADPVARSQGRREPLRAVRRQPLRSERPSPVPPPGPTPPTPRRPRPNRASPAAASESVRGAPLVARSRRVRPVLRSRAVRDLDPSGSDTPPPERPADVAWRLRERLAELRDDD